jgi:protein-L-isoaspartate(D-aspartate) O-methyltransferase
MNKKIKPVLINLLLLFACVSNLFSAGCASERTVLAKETVTATAVNEDDRSEERNAMVERAKTRFDLENTDVLSAMARIPRHLFVPENVRDLAYFDTPLPIGHGQTISAPYMAAWMTEVLALEAGERVLEIGTGSGYQAAVLAELGYAEVYSIEIIPELAEQAAVVLNQQGYQDLHLKQGDGYFGWEEHAPYDAIIVTAAPDHLPAPLMQQLADGGRLLIPIGPTGGYQTMWRFVKEGERIKAYNHGGVVFVPLVSEGEPQPLQFTMPEE